MYRKYSIDIKNAIEKRSGTDGFQPKFHVDKGENFLKVQCKLSNEYVNDWRVEDIASRLCENLGFYAVKQHPCYVELNITPCKLYGVVSENFEKKGLQYISFEKLLNMHNDSLQSNSEFNSLDNISKMIWISKKASLYTNNEITFNQYLEYMKKIAIIDILVCNVDRHPRNFGCVFNIITHKYEIAPIFDCGMGLFEHDIWLKNYNSFEECLNYCYIEPYSEDPFKLLDDLDKVFNICKELRKYKSALYINKNIFPSEKGYNYYKEVLKRIGV